MSFEPKLLGFLCQNSADLCADFAGMEQKNYTPNFLPVKLTCLGGLDSFFLLKAYFSGADGVLVLGCPPGRCRHKRGNDVAKRRVQVVQSLLDILGIGKDRLDFAWIHPSEISKLVETVNGFNERLTQLGPSVFLRSEDQAKFHWMTEFKKCDHCYQCKEVCPICFCKKCYPETFPNFGVGWLVHVIERCTNCGACKDVCPQGIRLFEIVQLLQQKMSNLNALPLNFPLPKGSEKVGVVNITK
jgi:coenzyme F420-reducing hydrogenase delta subunit/NAD-dependent dihydropyrimidine dehydrogenase PreA subunit